MTEEQKFKIFKVKDDGRLDYTEGLEVTESELKTFKGLALSVRLHDAANMLLQGWYIRPRIISSREHFVVPVADANKLDRKFYELRNGLRFVWLDLNEDSNGDDPTEPINE